MSKIKNCFKQARQNESLLINSEPKIENILDFPLVERKMTIPSPVEASRLPQDQAMKNVFDTSPSESSTQMKKDKYAIIAKKLKLSLHNHTSPSDSSKAPSENAEMRFFVGRLCPLIDEKDLKIYFSSFGEVVDVFFPRDSNGKTRGFAYVTFSRMVSDPMKTSHAINGHDIYFDLSHCKQDQDFSTQTVLASGIIYESTDDAIINHFSKYGTVVRVTRSKETRRKFSRWAFIHFENCESAKKTLMESTHVIDGHLLDVRPVRDFFLYHKKEISSEKVEKSQESALKVECEAKSPNVAKPTASKSQTVDVKKLLIHNLDYRTTTDSIREHFSKYCTVIDAYIPTVYGTNDSKGFGYVVVPASEAHFNFSGHVIDDRLVHISREGIINANEKTTTVLVSAGPEIMKKVSELDLKKFFSRFGEIVSVRKPAHSSVKKCSHYAFVEFTTTAAVDKALGKSSNFSIQNAITFFFIHSKFGIQNQRSNCMRHQIALRAPQISSS